MRKHFLFWLKATIFSMIFFTLSISSIGQNVGIGTTVPTEKLQINDFLSADSSYIKIASRGENFMPFGGRVSGIKLLHHSDPFGFKIESYESNSGLDTLPRGLYFSSLNGEDATDTRLFIDRLAGHVGIGTVTPAHPLTVATGPGVYTAALSILPSTADFSKRAEIRLDDWAILQDISGTNNTKDFAIYQQSTGLQRFVIATGGNVGIGTITPAYTLDVRGPNPEEGGIISSGNADLSHKLVLFGGHQNDPNPFIQWKDGDPLRFATDAGGFKEWMRINPNGNVGIGTMAPVNKIEIGDYSNSNDTYLAIKTTGGNQFEAGIKLRHFSDDYGFDLISDETLNGFGGFRINHHLANTAGVDVLTISHADNVGIGTTNPSSKLQVIGNTSTTNFQMTAGATNNFVLKSDAAGNASWVNPNTLPSAETDPQVGANTTNYLSKWNGDALVTSGVFENGGNVGIGIPAPTEKLHVAGNIRVQNDASIFGLDQLVGFNDLKFSGDAVGGTDMSIGADGRIGINVGPFSNALIRMRSKPDDLYTMYLEDNNAVFRFGVSRTGYVGINQIFDAIAFNVRGALANQRIFNVVNSAGNTSFFNVEGNGTVNVTGTLSKGGGSFKIDHPLDPENKYLYHSFVESPDMMNVYNGNITTNSNGEAVVTMPDWFEALNKDFRYQLTTIGQPAQAWVQDELKGNRFALKTDKPNVKVSWQITGIRKDAWAEKNRIPVEENKKVKEKGKYLHPESYGKSADMGEGKAMLQELPKNKNQ